MSSETETVTLTLPPPLYDQLQKRASQSHRSIEEEALEVLAVAIPAENALPTDLAAEVDALRQLDDSALLRTATRRLADAVATQLEQLHLKQRREGLSAAEAESLAALVRQYERNMLLRAKAVAVLKERGHDVSKLTSSP